MTGTPRTPRSDPSRRLPPQDMRAPDTGIFLEKQSYRRRRVIDAARVLPIIGIWLFMLPLIWPTAGDDTRLAAVPMSSALVFVFAAWCVLISCAAGLAWMSGGDAPGRRKKPSAGQSGARAPER